MCRAIYERVGRYFVKPGAHPEGQRMTFGPRGLTDRVGIWLGPSRFFSDRSLAEADRSLRRVTGLVRDQERLRGVARAIRTTRTRRGSQHTDPVEAEGA
jgi:hypothetical protein